MEYRNRDRGTIKWTAMMLPEHVKLLHEWQAEDDYVPKPQHDEYDFEELAHQIKTAVQTNSLVHVTYWQNGEAFSVEGTVQALPMQSPKLVILSPQGNKAIYIPHILKLHLYDE